ncbi:hypothetical protein OEZ77_25880, partial [Leclercia adecarboxylata]|uniref:hypothetical protein n=1 Tax=Leclercia adecarboxylata TaxID=83655 RepID=UPI00234CFE19
MPGLATPAPAIVVLGASALDTARRIQRVYPGAQVHGLSGRAVEADRPYDNFGEHLRDLYRANTPIIALCA